MRLRSTVRWCLFFCASLCLARDAAAQTTLPAGQFAGVSAGLADGGRIDQTASPLRYAGHGFDIALTWGRTFAPFSIVASLQGDARRLSPLDGSGSSSENVTEGKFSVAVLRPNRGALLGASDLSAGIGFAAGASVVDHTYANAGKLLSEYLFATATLGPVIAWSRALGGGRLTADAAMPLLAFVDHPYSDIRGKSAPLSFRFASLSNYRELNGGLSFSRPVSRTMGIVYAYHVGVVHFDDDQPVRSVTQRISVGLTTKLGGRATQ